MNLSVQQMTIFFGKPTKLIMCATGHRIYIHRLLQRQQTLCKLWLHTIKRTYIMIEQAYVAL